MGKVTAMGVLFGQKIKVECEKRDGEFVIDFDGKENELLERIARDGLAQERPIAGTYFPPADSLLNAYNYFQYYFFDELETIDVDGDIEEIPFEKGVVY